MAAPTAARTGGSSPLRPPSRSLPFPLSLYETAVGKKWTMAVTGLGLLGFVIAHMIGNLKLYLGRVEHNGVLDWDIDHYGEALRELLTPIFPEYSVLWILRLGLIAMFGLHIHAAVSLTRLNLASNKAYSGKRDWLAANYASRTMRWTGPIIGLYVLFHLADLTFGWANPDFVYGEVHDNLVGSLERWWVAAIYIVANTALALHLFHGIWSMFQTLGVNNPRYNGLRRYAAMGISALILVGNLSFPIAVLSGLVD